MNELLLRRRVLMMAQKKSRLPSEYQEVEYLESMGTQWINSGVVVNNDSTILCDFAYNSLKNTDGIYDTSLFGVGVSGTVPAFFTFYTRENSLYARKVNFSMPTIPTNTLWHRVVFGKTLVLDNVFYGNSDEKTFTNKLDLYIFKNSQRNLVTGAQAKIALFSIYDNSTLVRDFIPCYRKSDHKPGMYDLVTKTFFTNAGTGEFIVGADVN